MFLTWIANWDESPPSIFRAWTVVMGLYFFSNYFMLLLWLCHNFNWPTFSIICVFQLASGAWVANPYLNPSRSLWMPFHPFANINFAESTFVLFLIFGQIHFSTPNCLANSHPLVSPYLKEFTLQRNLISRAPIHLLSFSPASGNSLISSFIYLLSSINLVAPITPSPNHCYFLNRL
jgi:hypothetical protein